METTNLELKLSHAEEPITLDSSAKTQLSVGQKRFFVGLLCVLVVGLVKISPLDYMIGFITLLTLCYLALLGLNVYLVCSASSAEALAELNVDISGLDREHLPTYAILVPLFREIQVLHDLIINLCALDYPTDKLNIILLLESDDTEMVNAVEAMTLPDHFKVLVIPASLPRTKPKALNVGLRHVDSEFCVVYDAEDKPDPQQLLKAVAAFRSVGPEVICFQAMLRFHNPADNLLTQFFAAEYASWFNLYIPGLARNGWLFLLGGTSNHFRTQPLREVGAWDPYNVTEDADLGIRIARAGYKVKAIASVTWEEANGRPISWVKQRSRWIKGYMQTYLAHMRNPLRLFRQLGLQKFIVFQMLCGVAPMSNMINPMFWIMTLIYILTRWDVIQSLYPGPLLYLGSISLFLGNYIAVYINLTGSLLQGEYGAIKWMLLSPMYWVLMSMAAWKAFHQLIFKPHYWEKTKHGTASKAHAPKAAETIEAPRENREALQQGMAAD